MDAKNVNTKVLYIARTKILSIEVLKIIDFF